MEYVITTYGGGELFTLVFNAIAALFKSDQTGMVLSLIRVGLMVGLVYVVILMFFQSTLIEGMKWFLWVVVATNLLFLPKTTIYVHDPLTKTKNKVDGVPFALGAFAGFVSTVGKTVTEKFESVFTLPNYMTYHQTGTVFASSLMSQVGQFRITDPLFKGNMERFINQCVVYDAMIGHKYTLTDLQNQNDIWTLVSSKASPVLGFLYKDGNNPGGVITCKAGAQKLNTLWKAEIEKATAIYGSRVQNQELTKTLFFSHLQNGYQLLSDVAKSAEDILKQEMMINAIEEASNNKLSELGATSNYAATKALLQQRSAYAVAGEIAARTLPLFKNVIEALSYALFIFIVVLALLPNGYRILMTYCGILVWTQLWAPLYAVLNLIMTLYGKSETKSLLGEEGLTLLNSSAIINANADMVTLAAWLSVSIPFISYGILKQGAAAFVGLAQHLGSAMQSAASGAAAEAVSGNVSLGNVTMGTQAYQNTSAFQHNTSPTYNASQFRSMSVSGLEQSTFADGSQAFNDQAISRLSVQIMGTENTSFAEQHNFNQAQSLARTTSVAATNATEASLQSSAQFMSQLGSHTSKGIDYSKNINTSETTALQNFSSFVDTLQKSEGLSETQATEVALAVGMGGNLGFLSAEAKGSFSSAAARQQAIEKGTSLAQQSGYSENTEKVVAAAQSLSEGNHDSKGAELGKGVLSNLNHAKGLREETAIAQSHVDTLSKDMNSSQSKGIAVSKNLTQEVLDFIAHQPSNPGPDGVSGGQIGYKDAQRILETGGEERAAYLSRFQEQNPQYAIQSINVGGVQQDLTSRYETQAQQHKNSSDIQAQHTSHTQNVQKHVQAAGLDKTQASLGTTSHNTKQTENLQKEAPPYATQSIPVGGTVSAPSSSNEDKAQIQNQNSSSGVQFQYASSVQSEGQQVQGSNLFNNTHANVGTISDTAKQATNSQKESPSLSPTYATQSLNEGGIQSASSSPSGDKTQVQNQSITSTAQNQFASPIQSIGQQVQGSNFFNNTHANLSTTSDTTKQADNLQKKDSSYAPRSINVEHQGFSSHHESQAQNQRTPTAVQAQHAVQTQHPSTMQSIEQQAQATGFNETQMSIRPPENPWEGTAVKDAVLSQMTAVENKIEAGIKQIAAQKETFQNAEKESQEKTLGVTAVKNLAVSGTQGALSAGKDVLKAIEKLPPPPPTIFP